MSIPILTYHSWLNDGSDYATDNHLALAQDLRAIARLGLEVVALEHIVDALLQDRLYELDQCVGISFDDGTVLEVEDVTLASGRRTESFLTILRNAAKSRFIHATCFVAVSSDAYELPQEYCNPDWFSRAEKSGLIKIENHSWSHATKPPENFERADAEIRGAADYLDSRLGAGYARLLAYPYGRSSAYLVEEYLPRHIASHRVKAAFGTEPAPVTQGASRWNLPRYVCGRDWNSAEELEHLLADTRRNGTPTVAVVRPPMPSPKPIPKPSQESPRPSTEALYSQAWNLRAADDAAALAAVDGSGDEEMLQRTGRFTAAQVRKALNLQAADAVMELGCGVGRIGRELLPNCGRWLGADISPNMLRVAEKRLRGRGPATLLQLKRTALTGLGNGQFEKAYSVAVFCHLDKEDVFLYLQELHRVLKPGGWLYFETWNLAHPVGWKRWEYEVRHWAHADHAVRKDVARNQFSVPEEVQLMTRNAGFEIGACYSDSAWVQTVAIKPGPNDATESAREYLRLNASAIANSPQWSECFSRKLDLLYGEATAGQVLDWLDAQPQTEDVRLYRDYLMALWKRHQSRWGPMPPAGPG